MRSEIQNLTFKDASIIGSKYKVELSEKDYINLGLKRADDKSFINLAMLISDQCMHTTNVAVFSDEDNTEFLDAREFKGSILKQLDECLFNLGLCNRTRVTIS